MTLSAIPGKSPETKKIVFHFLSNVYVVTKLKDQYCSNAISRLPLQIFPAHVFNFRPTLNMKGSLHKKQANKLSGKIKGSSYRLREKLKIFIFSKMAEMIFIKFCRFIVHSTSQQYDAIGYSRKNS